MSSRWDRVLSACIAVAATLLPTNAASAHGGAFVGPPPQPGKLPPGLPPPSDPVQQLWDMNVDELIAMDPVGPVTTGGVFDPEPARRKLRETRILPFLRSVIAGNHGSDFDLRSSAVLALAKTTSDPADLDLLFAAAIDRSAPKMLRETSALAPGLLRRTAVDQRFDASLLDRVRRASLDLYDGGAPGSPRMRCMAILAIGLLGDQPRRVTVDAGSGDKPTLDVGHELLSRFKVSKDFEEQVALLAALGLQTPSTVSSEVIDVLRGLATTGVCQRRTRGPVVQGHAILALSRLTGAQASGTLLRLLRDGNVDNIVRHAAFVGIGIVAPRLAPAARTAVAGELMPHADRGNPDVVSLALLSLGRLLASATQDPSDRTTFHSPAADLLLRQIDEASGVARRVAALATGFALRREPADGAEAACAAFRRRAIAALTKADEDGNDPELRGAAILALGLAHDRAAIVRFTSLVSRRNVSPELRGRAATALGVAGDRSTGPLEALRGALEPRSPEGVRTEAARSLGFLGDTSAMTTLLEEVRSDKSDTIRSRAAMALGALRRPIAVDPLIALASDKTANGLARAIAVSALGLLTDPERIRSLTRLSTDFDRVVVSDALAEAIGLL